LLSGQGSSIVDVLWHAAGNADIIVALCGSSENITANIGGFPNPTVNHPAQLCPDDTGSISTQESFSTSATPNLGPGYYELVVTSSIGCKGQGTFEIDAWPGPEISITNSGFSLFCVSAGFPIPTLHALNTDDG
jgi:hypothetical protein